MTTPGCRIVHGDFCKILESTRAYFAELGTAFWENSPIRAICATCWCAAPVKTGEILVDLVTTTQTEYLGTDMQEDQVLGGWKERLLGLELEGRFAGILHTLNDSLADVVQSDRTDVLYGQDYFYEELLGLRFRISPFSFFQTNSLGAEVLYDMARSYVGRRRTRWFSICTAAREPSPRSWLRWRKRWWVWRSWRRPWRPPG